MKRLVNDKLVTKVRNDYTLTKAGREVAAKTAYRMAA
jgi:predicted transcriptional regulator